MADSSASDWEYPVLIVTTGVLGALFTGLGIWHVVDANAAADEADAQQAALLVGSQACAGASYPACLSIDYQRGRRDQDLDTAIPLFITGGIGIVGTLVVAILGAPLGGESEPAASSPHVSVAPVAAAEGGGLSVRVGY